MIEYTPIDDSNHIKNLPILKSPFIISHNTDCLLREDKNKKLCKQPLFFLSFFSFVFTCVSNQFDNYYNNNCV